MDMEELECIMNEVEQDLHQEEYDTAKAFLMEERRRTQSKWKRIAERIRRLKCRFGFHHFSYGIVTHFSVCIFCKLMKMRYAVNGSVVGYDDYNKGGK